MRRIHKLGQFFRELAAMVPKRYRFTGEDGHYTDAACWGLWWTWTSWSAPIVEAVRGMDGKVRSVSRQLRLGRGIVVTRQRLAARSSRCRSDFAAYLDAYSTIPLQQTTVPPIRNVFEQEASG